MKRLKYRIQFNRKSLRITLLAVVLLLFLGNATLAINNFQNNTPVLGLRLNNRPIFFESRPQIEALIEHEADQTNQPLKFSYQDKIVEIKRDEIGTLNPTVISNELIEKGRTGSLWNKFLYQTQAAAGLKNEKLKGEISQSKLTIKLAEIQSDFNHEAEPIQPDFKGDLSKTIQAKDGTIVNTDKLTLLIIDNIFDPPADPLPLPVMKTFTSHKEEELAPIRKQAPELIQKPISISSGGLTFTLTTDDLKNMLTVKERPDPKDPKKLKLVLRLDDTMLNQKLGDFAEAVEKITNAEFDHHDASAAIYSQFYSQNRRLAQIPTGVRVKQVLGAQSGPKVAYLTFDDGPNSIYHPLILDILKQYGVKATFFLVGNNTQRDAATAQRTASEGHKIGNHSLTHSFLPNLSSKTIQSEISSTNDILKPYNGGQNLVLFRPPYGGVNVSVKKSSEDLGLKLTLWDVDPRDWSEPSTDELVRRVVTSTQSGSDILLHSNHMATVKALPKIIENLQSQGYSFDVLN